MCQHHACIIISDHGMAHLGTQKFVNLSKVGSVVISAAECNKRGYKIRELIHGVSYYNNNYEWSAVPHTVHGNCALFPAIYKRGQGLGFG